MIIKFLKNWIQASVVVSLLLLLALVLFNLGEVFVSWQVPSTSLEDHLFLARVLIVVGVIVGLFIAMTVDE